MNMSTSVVPDYYQYYPPIQRRYRGEGNKILVGTVVKANVDDLEYEVKEGFYRWPRKELTGVLQGVYGKRILLVRFWDNCENDMKNNSLT